MELVLKTLLEEELLLPIICKWYKVCDEEFTVRKNFAVGSESYAVCAEIYKASVEFGEFETAIITITTASSFGRGTSILWAFI